MTACEINFDGIVGPTHNYAGLSFGNVASMRHKASVSHPKQAALEGLAKMRLLRSLGVRQAVLPPHARPDLAALRRLGFAGTDAQVLEQAQHQDPILLAACWSASSMWAANAATVSPSADTQDARVHLTPANLISNFHRSLETPHTTRLLRAIFADPKHFVVHDPLPATLAFSDEGAANHMRFGDVGAAGVEAFVYGRRAAGEVESPQRFPARQTLEAAAAIARNHRLDPSRTLYLRQSAVAIDAGAFHNDVLAVANGQTLLCHVQAYADEDLGATLDRFGIRAFAAQIPLEEAVRTYLFNSQFVTAADGRRYLIAPSDIETSAAAGAYVQALIEQGVIDAVHTVDVRQSMRNGGGPACLRLRMELTAAELDAIHPDVLLDEALETWLATWIDQHYRERLEPKDLLDPNLAEESNRAVESLMTRLRLPMHQR
jgi:succinylarginine dihydrolase